MYYYRFIIKGATRKWPSGRDAQDETRQGCVGWHGFQAMSARSPSQQADIGTKPEALQTLLFRGFYGGFIM